MAIDLISRGMANKALKQYNDIANQIEGLQNSGVDATAREQIINITKQAEGIPSNLLSDDLPLDAIEQLEAYLKTCSGKKVVFPFSKTYTMERQLILDIDNIEIDFNNCLFKLPDNCNFITRYSEGVSIGKCAIAVINCQNVKIRNLRIDGNKTNIPSNIWCIGLWLQNIKTGYFDNITISNVNYHPLVVSSNTKNIKFNNTEIFNASGTDTGGDSSVYISNTIDDDIIFENIRVENDTETNWFQAFYVDGYNTIIKNLYAKNVGIILDYRKGAHFFSDVIGKDCESVLRVGASNETYTEYPSVTGERIQATGIRGDQKSLSAIYVIDCDKCHLKDIEINFDATANQHKYGVRVRKFYSHMPVKDVRLENITINNNETRVILLQSLTESVFMKNIRGKGCLGGSNAYTDAIRNESSEVTHYLEDCKFYNWYKDVYDDSIVVKYSNARTFGTTAQRPNVYQLGYRYYDIDIGKIVAITELGLRELCHITFTNPPTSNGDITITLNGVVYTFSVTTDMTVEDLAHLLTQRYYDGWTSSTLDSENKNRTIFRKQLSGEVIPATFDGGNTGVTASVGRTTIGTNNTWTEI